MGTHVDIVKNEWLNGRQVLAARFAPESDGVQISEGSPEEWAYLLAPLHDTVTGEMIYSTKEPLHFVQALHQFIVGSFVTVTVAHDDSECPFAHTTLIPMKQELGAGLG